MAVVTLAEDWSFPPSQAAVWGRMRTENLGVEKVVANVVSNPCIRFVVVCGREIRGHRAGQSLIALWENGFDGNRRIVGARGAMPYVENLDEAAVDRFRRQVEVVDLVDRGGLEEARAEVARLAALGVGPFGEPPFVAVRAVRLAPVSPVSGGLLALHRALALDPYGEVRPI